MGETSNRDYRDYRDYRDGGNYRDGGDYRDGGSYRDGDYREDYRDYRANYRDEYGRNQREGSYRSYRDRYGRNRRSQGDYMTMLEEIIEDGMELARAYEDVSEMAMNNAEKNKLMKMAEREKEHYRMIKEMLQNRM